MARFFLYFLLYSVVIQAAYAAGIEQFGSYRLTYRSIANVEADPQYVYCATGDGVVRFDKHSKSFITDTGKGDDLRGTKVACVLYNPLTTQLLAFTDRSVYRNTIRYQWANIGSWQDTPQYYCFKKDSVAIKTAQGRIFVIPARQSSVQYYIGNAEFDWTEIRKPFQMTIFSDTLNEFVSIVDYEEIDSSLVFGVTDSGNSMIFDQYSMRMNSDAGLAFDKKITNVLSASKKTYAAGADAWQITGTGSSKIVVKEIKGTVTDIACTERYLVLATQRNGLYFLQNGKVVRTVTMSDGLVDNEVLKIVSDGGLIYAVFRMGMSVVDSSTFSVKPLMGIEYMNVISVSATQGLLVTLKHDGIRIYDRAANTTKRYTALDLSLNSLRAVWAYNGFVFAGGEGGLSIITVAEGSVAKQPQPSSTVTAVRADDVNIYAGTTDGFFVITRSNGRFIHYTTYDGLLDDSIEAVFTTDLGVLISTKNGLNRWIP